MRWAVLPSLLLAAVSGCIVHERVSGPPPLTKGTIIRLHEAGMPDDEIIDRLYIRGIERPLTADDIVDLKQAGLSDDVVAAAVDAPVRPATPPPRRRRSAYAPSAPHTIEAIEAGIVAGHMAWQMHRFLRHLFGD